MEIKISNEDDLVEEFKKVDIQYTKFFTVKQNGNNIQTSCGLCVESLKNDEKEYKERCILNPDLPIEIFEETYRKSMNNSSKKKTFVQSSSSSLYCENSNETYRKIGHSNR